jgi:hypothetical protein
MQEEQYPLAGPLLSWLDEAAEENEVTDVDLAKAARIVSNAGFVIDKHTVCMAVKKAMMGYEIIDKFRSKGRSAKCLNELDSIRSAVDKLVLELSKDNDATDLITRNAAGMVWDTHKLQAYVRTCCEIMRGEIGSGRRYPKSGEKRYAKRILSPKAWLAAIELPCVFEELTGKVFLKNEQPSSDMMEFILATMSEFGIRYKRSSIATEIRRNHEKRWQRRLVRQRRQK